MSQLVNFPRNCSASRPRSIIAAGGCGARQCENHLAHRVFGPGGGLAALLGDLGSDLFFARFNAFVQGLHQKTEGELGAEMRLEMIRRHSKPLGLRRPAPAAGFSSHPQS